jgi:hypothetical protein
MLSPPPVYVFGRQLTCLVAEEEGDVPIRREEVLGLAEGKDGVGDGRLAAGDELEVGGELDNLFVYRHLSKEGMGRHYMYQSTRWFLRNKFIIPSLTFADLLCLQ